MVAEICEVCGGWVYKCKKFGHIPKQLRPIDADHFWFDGVLIDLVQLRYQLESLNSQTSREKWWDVHERNRVFGNLRRRAEHLSKGKPPQEKWAAHTEKDLADANKYGLHTGWKGQRDDN